MRLLAIALLSLVASLFGACHFWPENLMPLAESIAKQVSGEATAWLAAGNIVLIDVARSPVYRAPRSELETLATETAEQAIEYVDAALESIAISFH